MYLVRLLAGAPAKMRDGRGFGSPVKLVTVDDYVPFDTLPTGLTENGGQNVEVKKCVSQDEAIAFMSGQEERQAAERAEREEYRRKVQAKMDGWRQAAEAKRKAEEAAKPPPVADTEPARLSHVPTAEIRRRRKGAED